MADPKDISKESFILIRFEAPNSTKIIDFKQNNIDEFQMVGAAQMLELVARKIMVDGMNGAESTVEPPKLFKP